MKKITLLTICCLFVTIGLFSQTVLITEDFETYTSGDNIAQTAGAPWGTWSGTTGNNEDPLVSSTQAHAGTNSINVITNNDCVVDLGMKTTGRYQIDFYIYVVNGNMGYFNLLTNFAGTNSEWATQVYLYETDSAYVDANGESSANFIYAQDTWLHVNYIVDLDDDYATLYIDNNEIISWPWTSGSFGNGVAATLDAVNFFGHSDAVGSNYYIDDFTVTQQIVPDAPISLTASVSGSDVDLSWTAPGSGTPDSYILTRNDITAATGVTTLTHTDLNVYPSLYTYNARAHYAGLGYSHASNDATADVLGYTNRELVLFEIGTGTECGFCPGSAMGAMDLVTNGHDVAIVEYHNYNNGDLQFNTPASAQRAGTYYMMTGYPTTEADGTLEMVGGSATLSLYPSYLGFYNKRVLRSSLYTIATNITQVSTTDFTAQITVDELNNYISGTKTLHTALTESDIVFSWQNQTELHWACRNMFPDALGTSLDFSSQTQHIVNINFTIDPAWVKDNCEFTIFLQDDATKEVMQTIMVDMATIVGVNDMDITELSVYPNPAQDQLSISSPLATSYSITDIRGVEILSGSTINTISNIDISDLNTGMYIITLKSESSTEIVKFVKE